MKLRHLDLCSGIGGFSLGLEATGGFKTIGFAEIEPWCCAVLKKHWPKVKNYGDIGTIRTIRSDIITAGFPCQPFSCAGEQRGAEDDRHIWPAVCNVIAQNRPAWFIGENVSGIIAMELDNCCADLEDQGYEVQPIIIPACAVDARHRRDRVWIIAHALQSGGSAKSWKQQGQRTEKSDCGGEINANANFARRKGRKSQQLQKRKGQWTARTSSPFDGNAARELRERNRKSRNRSGQSSNPSRWKPQSGICGVADGIPNRIHRLKSLGNSIVPQIAQIIGEIILQTYV